MPGIFGAPLIGTFAGQEGANMARMAGTLMPGQPAPVVQQFKPRKRTLADNLGLLADAFRGRRDNAEMLAQQEQQDRAMFLASQRPQQDFAEWQRKFDYEAAHPKAVNNDTAADYAFWKERLSPEQFAAYVESKTNPPQLMMTPQGIVSVPRAGGGMGASPAVPDKPVGKLTPLGPGGAAPQPRPFR